MATLYKQLTDYFELMELNTFLQQLRSKPDSIAFTDTIAVIDANYDFTQSMGSHTLDGVRLHRFKRF